MASTKELNVDKERSYLVVKSNDLILKSRYSLSTNQNKLLLYLISRIKPNDNERTVYTISIRDYCKICGVNPDGRYYKQIKRDIQAIADVSCWIKTTPHKESLFRWINSAEIDRGKISVSFHETVWPHLFNLSERFTQYSFFNVLAFENRYSSRLYDVLSAVCYLGGGSFEIEFLRERLDAENTYVENAHFIRDAVVPAVKEINLFSDLSVQYETVKEGAAIHKINFSVEKKDGLEHPIAQRNTLYALSGEKDKIEEI